MAKDEEEVDEKVTGEEELKEDGGVYSPEEREELEEADELEPWEAGFMEGEEGEGEGAKCRQCGKLLTPKSTVEEEIGGKRMWFCSSHCAEKFEQRSSAK